MALPSWLQKLQRLANAGVATDMVAAYPQVSVSCFERDTTTMSPVSSLKGVVGTFIVGITAG